MNQEKCKRRSHRNVNETHRVPLKAEVREEASAALSCCSQSHPPAEARPRDEYSAVFTTVRSHAPHNSNLSQDAPHHPPNPCSSCLQEAAEGLTRYFRPVKSHSSYLCFLRFSVSTATKPLQPQTTAAELFARLKQQNCKYYRPACGLSNKLYCDCFSISVKPDKQS